MKPKPTLTLMALLSAISVFAQYDEAAYKRFVTTYLPLPDRLTLDTAYIGQQVRTAMHARAVVAWGADVPEALFRHFVVPPRVEGETLDASRQSLADELLPLVGHADMATAAQEVNHWCRAHADIRPTDGRTLAPSATIATGYGNSTEVAVVLVAALRAVCIPSRLVVGKQMGDGGTDATWVEAWCNGEWRCLEPCHPAPDNIPAAILKGVFKAKGISACAFGQYDGEEKHIVKGALLTTIDRTDAYRKAAAAMPPGNGDTSVRTDHARRLASDDAQRQARDARLHEPWRGNAATIEAFLAGPWDRRMAHTLLGLLTEKDLHDVTLDVLHDNIYTQSAAESLNDIQMSYVVNPRIEQESLTPYKWLLRKSLSHIDSIPQLVRWCRDSILLVSGQNPHNLRQTPAATYRHRQADAMGKKLFFVAAARSLGWPARINDDGQVEWHDDEQWRPVPPLSYIDMVEHEPHRKGKKR